MSGWTVVEVLVLDQPESPTPIEWLYGGLGVALMASVRVRVRVPAGADSPRGLTRVVWSDAPHGVGSREAVASPMG